MTAVATPNSRSVKLGAEPKRVAILVLFLAIAVFLWWRNSQDSDIPKSSNTASSAARPAAQQALPIAEPAAPSASVRPNRRGARNPDRNTLEMRPIDPTQGNIDPTLRLELLERLSTVKPAGLARSLFEVGTAPVIPVTGKAHDTIIKVADRKPQKPAETTPGIRETKAPIIPITLKFYGFARPSNPSEPKRGFFLDGDVILVAAEGDIVKSHYKILKLQDHSAIVEDMADKNQQTLVLTPEGRGDL